MMVAARQSKDNTGREKRFIRHFREGSKRLDNARGEYGFLFSDSLHAENPEQRRKEMGSGLILPLRGEVTPGGFDIPPQA